jgi:ribosomal protein S27E
MANEETSIEKMNGGYLCTCGAPVIFADGATMTLCHICGKVQNKPKGDASKNWLQCLDPEGFEWFLPVGVKGPDVPEKDGYIDYDALVALPMNANVRYTESIHQMDMARMDWIKKYKQDPAIQLAKMRKRMKRKVPIVHLG